MVRRPPNDDERLPLSPGPLFDRSAEDLAERRGADADAWLERAIAFLQEYAREHGSVTADDLWEWTRRNAANRPVAPEHVGQAVMTARNRRLLANTGRTVVSRNPSRNGSRIHVWRIS